MPIGKYIGFIHRIKTNAIILNLNINRPEIPADRDIDPAGLGMFANI